MSDAFGVGDFSQERLEAISREVIQNNSAKKSAAEAHGVVYADHEVIRFDPSYEGGGKAGVEVVNGGGPEPLYSNQTVKALCTYFYGKVPMAYSRWRKLVGCDPAAKAMTLKQAFHMAAISKVKAQEPGVMHKPARFTRLANAATHQKQVYRLLEALASGYVLGKELPIALAYWGMTVDFAMLRSSVPGFSTNKLYPVLPMISLMQKLMTWS